MEPARSVTELRPRAAEGATAPDAARILVGPLLLGARDPRVQLPRQADAAV